MSITNIISSAASSFSEFGVKVDDSIRKNPAITKVCFLALFVLAGIVIYWSCKAVQAAEDKAKEIENARKNQTPPQPAPNNSEEIGALRQQIQKLQGEVGTSKNTIRVSQEARKALEAAADQRTEELRERKKQHAAELQQLKMKHQQALQAQQETHAQILKEQLEALKAKHREAVKVQSASQEEQKGAHARSLEAQGKELEAKHQAAIEQLEAKHRKDLEAQQETHAKTLREQLEALQAKHREATEAQAASQEEQKGAHARSLEVKGKELEAEHQVAMEQLEAKHEQAIQSVQEDNEKKLQEMTEKIEQLTNGLGEFEALFEEGDSSFLDQAETSLEGMLGYAKVADPILAQLPLVLKGEKPEQGEICKEVQPVYELYQALQQTTEKLRLKSKEVEDQKSAHDAELQKAKSNYDVELKAQELKLIQAHQKAMEEKKAELERVGQELAALRAQLEKKQEEMAASFEAQIAEKEQALKTLDQAMDALVKDPTEKVDVSEAMVPIFEKFRMLVDQKEKLKLQNHSLLSGLQRAAAANKLQEDLNFIVSKNRKKSSPEQQAIIREARQVHDEVKKLLICIGKCVEAETAVLKKIRAQRDVGLDLVKFRLGKKFKKGALPTQATYKELARSIISLWAVYMKAETKLKHQRTIVDKALGALAVN